MELQRSARAEESRQRTEYNQQRANYASTMEQAKRERLAARLQVCREGLWEVCVREMPILQAEPFEAADTTLLSWLRLPRCLAAVPCMVSPRFWLLSDGPPPRAPPPFDRLLTAQYKMDKVDAILAQREALVREVKMVQACMTDQEERMRRALDTMQVGAGFGRGGPGQVARVQAGKRL